MKRISAANFASIAMRDRNKVWQPRGFNESYFWVTNYRGTCRFVAESLLSAIGDSHAIVNDVAKAKASTRMRSPKIPASGLETRMARYPSRLLLDPVEPA